MYVAAEVADALDRVEWKDVLLGPALRFAIAADALALERA